MRDANVSANVSAVSCQKDVESLVSLTKIAVAVSVGVPLRECLSDGRPPSYTLAKSGEAVH